MHRREQECEERESASGTLEPRFASSPATRCSKLVPRMLDFHFCSDVIPAYSCQLMDHFCGLRDAAWLCAPVPHEHMNHFFWLVTLIYYYILCLEDLRHRLRGIASEARTNSYFVFLLTCSCDGSVPLPPPVLAIFSAACSR